MTFRCHPTRVKLRFHPSISSLIGSRARELGLSDVDLVRRCGYQNIAKGLRRLREVREGKFKTASQFLAALPVALALPPEAIERVVCDTEREGSREREQRYREVFRPHSIILTNRSRPEPIFVAAIFGVDRILRLELVPGSSPVSFLDQSLKGLENRLREFKSDVLPAFGRPTGVAVNYSEVSSVTFDLQGNPLRVFDHIIEPGNVFLSMGGRAISDDEIQVLLWGPPAAN